MGRLFLFAFPDKIFQETELANSTCVKKSILCVSVRI